MVQRKNSVQSEGPRSPPHSTQGRLEAIDDETWQQLSERVRIVRNAGKGPLSRAAAKRLAKHLSVHWTTVYRWRRKLADADRVTSLTESARGFPRGSSRLSVQQKYLMRDAITKTLRRSKFVRLVDLVEEVRRACAKGNVPAPSRTTIARHWKKIRVEQCKPVAPPGKFAVYNALDVVQIDHTVSDVIIVDELYRAPIGRPYLTIALDVCTRSIVASVLSFKAPSAATVALCLARIAAPKDEWISRLGLDSDWPMSGLPRSIHLDNAPEFHSRALQRGCAQFGIEIIHRPAGRPHFGGHVERNIGTLMRRFETLPGATGPSTRNRKQRKPEETATMTLAELEKWLVIEIADRYHHRPHKGLHGATPMGKWLAAPPSALEPEVWQDISWAFMPAVTRSVRREGVQFSRIRYWHSIFAEWALTGETVVVHYDPRDLSRVRVVGPNNTVVEATYADLRHPPVSIWEADAAAAHLRSLGQSKVRESGLFAAIDAQRDIVRQAAQKARKARLHQARQPQQNADSTNHSVTSPDSTGFAVDDNTSNPEFKGEIWSS